MAGYKKVIEAVFVDRPNRFVANVMLNGVMTAVHVKNTGRCRELLRPGCSVWLAASDNAERKYRYDLIAVSKHRDGLPELLINMDSQLPNAAAAEWVPRSGLFSENAVVRREVTFGSSRFDIYVEDGERRAFIEVKGVTLEDRGLALFPDAPTERGVKHVTELCRAVEAGYEAYILFVIQFTGAWEFRPNTAMHPEFAEALRCAQLAGVQVLAVECSVTPACVEITASVPVKLSI